MVDEFLKAIVLSVHFFVIYIDNCAGPHHRRHEPPLGIHGFLTHAGNDSRNLGPLWKRVAF
ncbi:hypothetical protein GCM10011571_25430 [Marinithermofilum abyssi]|uniref:Uncharacterized protein n=1 Tax=Marinithermofilum abyssi TaxID=1571185 RepID=A0A8J2VJ43_9BACL|nr:hypothetical protein GCM10011571_25430 [Marinithermofilum abyssi]